MATINIVLNHGIHTCMFRWEALGHIVFGFIKNVYISTLHNKVWKPMVQKVFKKN